MSSKILDEIRKIRGEEALDIITENSDRHRVLVRGTDEVSVYGFSVPIYSMDDGRLVDLRFRRQGETFCAKGSSAQITVDSGGVTLKKRNLFRLLFDEKQNFSFSEEMLSAEKISLLPTTNGVLVRVHTAAGESVRVAFESNLDEPKTRKNSKYFAYLEEKFRPYASVCALYKSSGGTLYPLRLSSQKNDGGGYNLELKCDAGAAGDICFEVNVYENKLFQDTTVESGRPKENNAFGSVAFLGQTDAFGEQYLFSKLDFTLLDDLRKHRIKSVKLYFPVLGDCPNISVYRLEQRFCSFGSNWKRNAEHGQQIMPGLERDYLSIDITELVCDNECLRLYSHGILLRADSGNCVMATGDSYFAPQIIEIRYES